MTKLFKVGDKVKIPKTKSVGININDFSIQCLIEKEKHDYLIVDYVININAFEQRLSCMFPTSKICTDFLNTDLEHYEEFPKKWVISLYPEVKKWIEDNFKSSKYTDYCESTIFHFPNWKNKNGFLEGSHTYFDTRKNYKKITLEQFKKHILKEKEMERKIKGYVLIKEYPGSKGIGYFEKYTTGELSKYPEFWKPVYEEEFKVGDWVTVTEVEGDEDGWLNYCSQRTFKLEKAPTSYYGGIYWGVYEGGLHAKFRKATPEEIEAAEAARKTIIKMHSSNKGEFEIEVIDGKAWYRPDNKELPKEWIKRIINSYDDVLTSYVVSYNPYEIKMTSIKVGCMEGTRKEDWEKVYKLLK